MSEPTGEFENHEYPLTRAVVSANSAIWPPAVDGSKSHELIPGVLKGRRSLPLFCNPVVLFLFNWMVMLLTLSFQVTYVTYPYFGIPLLLCALSVASFLFGYLVARTTLNIWPRGDDALSYTLDVTMLWRLNLALCGALPAHHDLQLGDPWTAAGDWRSKFLPDIRQVQTGSLPLVGQRYGQCDA